MTRIAFLSALCALPVAGCGGDEADSPTAQPVAASSTAAAEQPAAVASPSKKKRRKRTKVVLGSSDFGKILFDSKRQAIYLFDKETTKRAQCYGECAEAWPPVYTKGRPHLGNGLDKSLLGTTKRRDGRKQVTYGGHPLYYYAHEGPGDVFCHDVDEFGGLWLVVQRNGDAVPGS